MAPNFQKPFVYVPTMHREFVPADVPAGIRSVWPGLPRARSWHQESSLWLIPDSLPFTPSQAASCMAELESLDENGLANLSLSTPEGQASVRRALREREDLAHFARSGGCCETVPEAASGENDKELLRWAQHYLLLGWLQEERVLDMDRLVARYRTGAQKLASHIGSNLEETNSVHAEFLSAMADLFPENPDTFLPSWRFMLELFSILLPPEILFCTADSRMIHELDLSEFPCVPAPREAEVLFSQQVEATACIQGPVWKLIGHREPDPDRPWLDTWRTVIVLRRQHGHE